MATETIIRTFNAGDSLKLANIFHSAIHAISDSIYSLQQKYA